MKRLSFCLNGCFSVTKTKKTGLRRFSLHDDVFERTLYLPCLLQRAFDFSLVATRAKISDKIKSAVQSNAPGLLQ